MGCLSPKSLPKHAFARFKTELLEQTAQKIQLFPEILTLAAIFCGF